MTLCAVASEPTRVSVIQSSQTSIEVTWKSPGPPVTGYRIFFSPDVGGIEVAGGDTESYMREGLQSGVDYSISIVALSPHLPSNVVGPITPSGVYVACAGMPLTVSDLSSSLQCWTLQLSPSVQQAHLQWAPHTASCAK